MENSFFKKRKEKMKSKSYCHPLLIHHCSHRLSVIIIWTFLEYCNGCSLYFFFRIYFIHQRDNKMNFFFFDEWIWIRNGRSEVLLSSHYFTNKTKNKTKQFRIYSNSLNWFFHWNSYDYLPELVGITISTHIDHAQSVQVIFFNEILFYQNLI